MGGDSDYVMKRFFGEGNQEVLAHIPHAHALGLEVIEVGADKVTMRLPMRPNLVGDPRSDVVFGGVITTLLDQAGGVAVMCSLKELVSIATIDLRIDYMKPATPGLDLCGWAQCYRLARRVAFVRGGAFHSDIDDPFAIFLSTYMIKANPLPEGAAEALASES